MVDIKNAKKEVLDIYKELEPTINSTVKKHSQTIDKIMDSIKSNITTLTNKEIQDYMLQLQIEAYDFAIDKDNSLMKQECAVAVTRTRQASIYNKTDGTQQYRQNQAIEDTIDSQTVQIIYNAVTNQLKSKLDEVHRMINVLSNVLISRNAEAKLKRGGDDS